jgi:uncharacterized protein YqeY
MRAEKDARGLAALKAYVTGETSEVVVLSDLREYRRDEVKKLLAEHRSELAEIDPARAVILESILPSKH